MLEDNNNLDAIIFFISPNGGICSAEDSDGEETVSVNHPSGPQLLVKAYCRVNYGHAVIDSKLEEEDDSEDHGVTTSTQLCMADETMKSDVDSLLVLSRQTQTTWEKRSLFPKSFSNLPPKLLFTDYISPTAKFDFFLTMKW